MSIQIEEGKFYKARNGEKYGPMRYDHATDTDYVWDSPENSSGWCADGRFVNVEGESDMDLIAEWAEPCALGSHFRGDDNNCTICDATPEQVNAQAREALLYVDTGKTEVREFHVEPDIKTQIADEAKRIVSGARRSAYGTPEQNFDRIAWFWTAYAKAKGWPVEFTAADVSPMMRLMKEARLAETPDHLDSHIDLVGYTLTGAEVNKVKMPT